MKKFQHYNLLFKDLERSDDREGPVAMANARDITKWDVQVQVWPQHFVQIAVYGYANDVQPVNTEVIEWQKFRVSMKGQSTRMKLLRLKELYVDKCYKLESKEPWARWKCRIDNYIGALVRGGQLNSKLEVVR